MKYLHESVSTAAKACVEELRRDGGIGGVIALDNAGNGRFRSFVANEGWLIYALFSFAMPMNCSGMYRGVVYEDGVPKTAIFDGDELD